MAIKVNISFKENSVDDVILYNFLDEKSKIIGKSAYIKHKYLSLHKMLVNKDELHVPTIEEAKNYSIKIKE